MHRPLRIVFIAALVAACGDDSSESRDTSVVDTAVVDSATPSETVGDTTAVDDTTLPTFTTERLKDSARKLDLLLVVDNSSSMADKQYVLSLALPELATRLATIEDMHIGLLSSSLGTFGASGCPDVPPAVCSGSTPNSVSNNDHGRLVSRVDPCGTTNVPTYRDQGFLAWDPRQAMSPNGIQDLSVLQTRMTDLVLGDGQLGCGFESQNEAWYRFLVDPTPYASISLVNNQVQTSGLDDGLLAERRAFLRPDSVLAVVVVSDESDTSLKQFSAFPLFAAPELHLPHASTACTFGGPSDPCCYSCGQVRPNDCPADPLCTTAPTYTSLDENTSLRAFGLTTHKERYGIEFFYQPSRYVDALTSPFARDANGQSVPNPIYSNLDPSAYPNAAVRSPSQVFYAAIVGVPWQLIARESNTGDADLSLGFKSASELSTPNAQGHTAWEEIVGDPEQYVAPLSPYMQESSTPRVGAESERTIATPADDIQYACTFTLPEDHVRDCSVPGANGCDCPANGVTDNPICNGSTQVAAKAYPGVKHLAIAKSMGAQGVVASICPKQLTASDAADYGYRPAVDALVDALEPALRAPCLPHALTDPAACVLVEARNAAPCTCADGRSPVAAEHAAIVASAKLDPQYATAGWSCFCEVDQLAGADLAACQSDSATTAGWCYVDAAHGAALVADCPADQQQRVHFVGDDVPAANAATFLACPTN